MNVTRRITPKGFRIVIALLVAVAGMLLCAPVAAPFQGLQVGMETPDFTLKTLDGATGSFATFRGGKMTAVLFWSTWSSKSEALLARMEKLYREKRGEGFAVIAVNVDDQRLSEQTIDRIRKTAAKLNLSYPIFLDDGLTMFHDFGVIALPSTLLLDSGRIVRYQLSGFPLVESEKMVDFVLDYLAGKKTAAASPIGHQPDKMAVRFFNMGRNVLKSGRNADGAEPWFKKALESDPDFILPRLSLGALYSQRGAVPLARLEYEQVLARDPANAVALCEMGMLLVNEGKVGEGEELFLRAQKAEEAYSPCYSYAGIAYGKKGRFEEAEQMFEAALRLNPRDFEINSSKGRMYEEAGNQRKAAEAYRKALETVLSVN